MKLAEKMFNAYNEVGTPWKTFDGRDVPRWPDINDAVRAKWTAAATTALRELVPPAPACDFGWALQQLREGKRVARQGWNGKGMWLALSPGRKDLPAGNFWSHQNELYAFDHGGVADVLPCITMKTADGKILMGWLASQTDMLANDWCVVLPEDGAV